MVDFLVSSQVIFVCKAFITSATWVVKLSRMNVPMFFEVVVGFERFFTDVTLKRPFTSVLQHVPLEFHRLMEGLLAPAAAKRSLFGMDGSHVVGEM